MMINKEKSAKTAQNLHLDLWNFSNGKNKPEVEKYTLWNLKYMMVYSHNFITDEIRINFKRGRAKMVDWRSSFDTLFK